MKTADDAKVLIKATKNVNVGEEILASYDWSRFDGDRVGDNGRTQPSLMQPSFSRS